jgi:hypothetical protein
MSSEILKPVVVLAAWSMIMWVWMYATRLPAMKRAGLLDEPMIGGTGASLAPKLPVTVQWKADNYNHLMEQPTVFYAVALTLAFLGSGDSLNAMIAWAYVGLRIAHSLVQVTVNRVTIRFALFILSGICLLMLTVHAVAIVFAR